MQTELNIYRAHVFPISRDPPEGGTCKRIPILLERFPCFQFLGIPPKGEHLEECSVPNNELVFPISRDPPEGGTWETMKQMWDITVVSNF